RKSRCMADLAADRFHGVLRHLSRGGDLGVHERSFPHTGSCEGPSHRDFYTLGHERSDLRGLPRARRPIDGDAVLLLRSDDVFGCAADREHLSRHNRPLARTSGTETWSGGLAARAQSCATAWRTARGLRPTARSPDRLRIVHTSVPARGPTPGRVVALEPQSSTGNISDS